MVGGRQTLVPDDLWWKTTFGGRRPFTVDDLPSVEDNLLWDNGQKSDLQSEVARVKNGAEFCKEQNVVLTSPDFTSNPKPKVE